MKKGTLFLVILVGFAVIAYLTNPNEAAHQVAGKEKLSKISRDILSDYGIDPGILSGFGVDFKGKFVDELIANHISRENYYLFSLTKVNWNDKSYVIGLGFFNKVFISNQVDEIIKKEVQNYIKGKLKEINIPFLDVNSLILDF